MRFRMSRRDVVIALAVGWLVAVLIVDLATGPSLRLAGLYVIAALIACARTRLDGGHITATCCFTWKPACFGKCG